MRDDLHERLLDALEGKLPTEVLDTWIRPLRVLDASDTRVELGVPNKFFRQHLEQHYLDALGTAVADGGRPTHPARSLDRSLAPAVAARSHPAAPP